MRVNPGRTAKIPGWKKSLFKGLKGLNGLEVSEVKGFRA